MSVSNTKVGLPIQSQHARYVYRATQRRKCRDAFEGEDEIKAAGALYLPKLKGQSDEDYLSYKRRALFYSITSKSLSSLVGMALSKPPKLKYPESMNQYFKGTKYTQFGEIYATALSEVLLQSRVGMLVDMPIDGGDPYPILYRAEDVINWRINDVGEPILIVVREEYDKIVDAFNVSIEYRYRELRINDEGDYEQTIHTLDDGDVTSTIVPKIAGRSLKKIPFVVVHPLGLGFADHKPMMLDIANINISHYMSSADLEHGRHFTGLPTPVLIGGDSDSELYIGSTKFLVIPDKGGDAKYLEFTGKGLESLEKAMTEKQSLLASMSARLLDSGTRGSEAADAVKLRYMSETASLSTVVQAIGSALSEVYKLIAVILRENPESFELALDTDFMESQLSSAEMTALFEGFFKGAISKQTLVYNMRKGRRLDPLRTDAEELSSIEIAKPETQAVKTEPSAVKPDINS